MKRKLLSVAIAALPLFVAAADDPASLDTVVVVGARAADGFDAAVLSGESLARQRAATSDTASLLHDISGLNLYGAGGVSSLPSIHGLADDRLRIKVDGMDLISACGNHMNPPLSYIDPSNVGSINVFAGISPVSLGGDSIGGAIQVNSAAPEFAAVEHGILVKGQAGISYRSNGNGKGAHLSATLASSTLSVSFSGSTTESGNYKAGGDFKPAGRAFIIDGKSIVNSTKWLSGDEVGSSMYKSTNQSLSFALRNEDHLVELKLGVQDLPYQGFPNQRMDMTANDGQHLNVRYQGRYQWGALEARLYHEHTRHKMNFFEDKAFWYQNAAPGMPMDTEGKNTGALIKADIAISAHDMLRVGGEYQRYRFNDWWLPSGTGGMSPNTFWDINDGQRDRLGIFAEWEARWTPQWLGQFGLRSETVRMNTGTVQGYKTGAPYGADAARFNAADRRKTDRNWDLTALARYTPVLTQTIEFGYARKTRSPNLYERFAWSTGGMAMNMINMVGDGNGYVGNLDLKPEVAHTLSATFDWHDADQEQRGFRLTPHYTYVRDYINARRCTAADGTGGACTLAAQNTNNNFVFLKYANQDVRLYGLDISGRMPLAQNTGFGSFSANGMLNYLRGKTASGAGDNLYNIMPLNAKLTLVQSLNNWTNSAELQLVDAKTRISQVRNELKTGGYGLLNLRSSYAWKQARFDVGIENVFDRLYSYPLGGAYVGQGTTMPPIGGAPYGIAVPGIGRNIYAAATIKF